MAIDKLNTSASASSLGAIGLLVTVYILPMQSEIQELKTSHALRCELEARYFDANSLLMTELGGIEKNTASRYITLAEANGGLSEVDRLRMEEKLRRQAEYESRGRAFKDAAIVTCLK